MCASRGGEFWRAEVMGVAEMVATDSRAKCHVCLDGSDGFVEAKLHSGGRVYLPLCRPTYLMMNRS